MLPALIYRSALRLLPPVACSHSFQSLQSFIASVVAVQPSSELRQYLQVDVNAGISGGGIQEYCTIIVVSHVTFPGKALSSAAPHSQSVNGSLSLRPGASSHSLFPISLFAVAQMPFHLPSLIPSSQLLNKELNRSYLLALHSPRNV